MSDGQSTDILEPVHLEREIATESLEKALEVAKEEISRLDSSLKESQQRGKQLERVIYFLRERSTEFHLETEQLRKEFQQQLQELQRFQSMCQELQQKLVGNEQEVHSETNQS